MDGKIFHVLDVLRDLERRGLFYIEFATHEATIPEHLRDRETCVLKFSHNFDPDDLVVGNEDVSQTLSFEGRWFKCRVPLSSIISVARGPGDEIPDTRPGHLRLVTN